MSDNWTHGDASVIQHCAVAGRLETRVRAFTVGTPAAYAQYPVAVAVRFIEPRRRLVNYLHVYPDNLRYLTIEMAGQVMYDSRVDVPCDMAEWGKASQRFRGDTPRRLPLSGAADA